jgi:hypothetical protein
MDKGICIRMAIQAFGMGNIHTAQNTLSAFHQLMDIITNPDAIHGKTIERGRR